MASYKKIDWVETFGCQLLYDPSIVSVVQWAILTDMTAHLLNIHAVWNAHIMDKFKVEISTSWKHNTHRTQLNV